MKQIGHFIDGRRVSGAAGRVAEVYNPSNGQVEATVSLGSADDLRSALNSARRAQPEWAATNPQKRARVMMRFVDLVHRHMDELAEILSREHGKTLDDSRGDIQRGIEVAEFVIGIPHLQKGEFTEGAGPSIDMYSLRQPLGVGAGITPFNFPAMIPLWMFSPAIACGNAFILKPSERDPSVSMRLAELLVEAGLPPGILNVVNGDKGIVDALLADQHISAVSFVGSTPIASYVYGAAASNGKRAQCFGGAKNHMIIMPDADINLVADALLGAGYGSAGERCMAISVAVPVGDRTAERLRNALIPRVEKLKVGPYTDVDVDFGPLISRDAISRIKSLVARGVEEGAELLIDGRSLTVEGFEQGFFMGPCLFDGVTKQMEIYRKEIFGPVLCIVRANDYEEALALATSHEYGNGVAIYTRDGDAARDFASRVAAGMIGINVPVPVPLAYHSFGGWKRSSFGDLNQHGPDSVKFWTRTKVITSRWPSGIKRGTEFSLPVMK